LIVNGVILIYLGVELCNVMIRETVVMRRMLWLALRKQLIGDYGNLDTDCEVLLLKDPIIHIVACADDDYVNVTITYNPLDIVTDIRKSQKTRARSKYVLDVPLHKG
jgi:hypothetical protein